MAIHDEWILRGNGNAAAPPSLTIPSLNRIAARRAAASGVPLEEFLHPGIEHLHAGCDIAGMEEACERIERAIRHNERILIYGDYDVDGVTSIVLLTTVIRILGGSVGHVVPHRLFDGYGLKMSVLDRVLVQESVKLVITVDCGITSIEPVQQAVEKGIDVIITDHHLPPSMLPEAAAVLNPRKAGCNYPFKELAGVGVAFKLACELVSRGGSSISTESLLKIAAIGTVADVAPLVGENRTITRLGLDGLADPRNLGLRTLISELGLLGKPLRSVDVGFKIGPRINAAGRLASADTAIELFAARDEATALRLVGELNRLNAERQSIEKRILGEAEAMVAGMSELPNIVVLAREGWHKGVLGLCAGKIAQQVNRPTVMLAIEGDNCVGSGRSAGDIDLHGLLSKGRDLLAHFGGHEFACGLSLETRNLEKFVEIVSREATAIPAARLRRTIEVEDILTLSELTPGFLLEHQLLEPFGAGNRQPLFAAHGVKVVEQRPFGNDCRDLLLDDGSDRRSAVLWPSRRSLLPVLSGGRTDLVFRIEPDRYGRFGLRLEIEDAAPEGSAPLSAPFGTKPRQHLFCRKH